MKDAALGGNAFVDLRAGIVRQLDRVTGESGEEVFEEMEFQEIVEERDDNNGGGNQVVPDWNERQSSDQEPVRIARRRRRCIHHQAIPIHGDCPVSK